MLEAFLVLSLNSASGPNLKMHCMPGFHAGFRPCLIRSPRDDRQTRSGDRDLSKGQSYGHPHGVSKTAAHYYHMHCPDLSSGGLKESVSTEEVSAMRRAPATAICG
jgi:hypothetical protein